MARRMWWVPVLAWGGVAGWWIPRGPLTGGQALWSVGISVAVGLLAGWASRSRWSMLIAPAAFVAALELTRLGATGPSVDGVHPSPFGLIALVTGRGVHGLLSLLPMTLAAAYGAALTRRNPSDARPSEVRPSDARPSDARPSEVRPRESRGEARPRQGRGAEAGRSLRYVRRTVTATLTAALLAFTVAVALPARTAPPPPRAA